MQCLDLGQYDIIKCIHWKLDSGWLEKYIVLLCLGKNNAIACFIF